MSFDIDISYPLALTIAVGVGVGTFFGAIALQAVLGVWRCLWSLKRLVKWR